MNWTIEQLRAVQQKQGAPNKYHAKRILLDGVWFDSKREAARFAELKLMRAAGLIADLETHPSYPITINDKQVCVVELDFKYWDLKQKRGVIEDVKGKDTPLSALKRKLVEAIYNFKIEVIK